MVRKLTVRTFTGFHTTISASLPCKQYSHVYLIPGNFPSHNHDYLPHPIPRNLPWLYQMVQIHLQHFLLLVSSFSLEFASIFKAAVYFFHDSFWEYMNKISFWTTRHIHISSIFNSSLFSLRLVFEIKCCHNSDGKSLQRLQCVY